MDVYLDTTIELLKLKYLFMGIVLGFLFGFAIFKFPSYLKSLKENRPK